MRLTYDCHEVTMTPYEVAIKLLCCQGFHKVCREVAMKLEWRCRKVAMAPYEVATPCRCHGHGGANSTKKPFSPSLRMQRGRLGFDPLIPSFALSLGILVTFFPSWKKANSWNVCCHTFPISHVPDLTHSRAVTHSRRWHASYSNKIYNAMTYKWKHDTFLQSLNSLASDYLAQLIKWISTDASLRIENAWLILDQA